MIQGNNYIGGTWRPGTGDPLQSTDPFSGEPVFETKMSAPPDVASAVEAARDAFPAWSAQPAERRQEILRTYAKLLDEHKSDLAELISREMGKPLWESKGEVGAMVGKVEISIKAMNDRCGVRETPMGEARSVTRFKPHGVVAVFGPFNFPGHLPNGHIVPALLAGNTVIFKPSELTPAVGHRMMELLAESGLSAGVVNLVQGDRKAGIALAEHAGIDGLFFTGSSSAGKAIHRAHGGRPEKILALEMGGNNPLIVHDMVDVDAAVYWTIQSSYITAGQRCVCARRLIVTDSTVNEEYLAKLVEKIPTIRYGHYTNTPEPFLGPVITTAAADSVISEQLALVDAGAKSMVTCRIASESPALVTPGLIDVTGVSGLADEEIFGPLLQLIRVADLDAAIEAANRTAYGLAAGIFCTREEDHQHFFHQSRAGIVNWNRPTTGASSAAPFGGIGQSGNHNPSAYFAADYCAYPVASVECGRLTLPEQQTPGLDSN